MVATTSLVHYLLLISLTLVCGSWIAIGCPGISQVSARGRVRFGVRVRPDTTDVKFECKIEKVTTTVKYDGCEDASVVVRACNGACFSAVQTVVNPPYVCLKCESCWPILYNKNKFRMVQFMCNGTETTHRVYMPLIKDCKCVNTTSTI